MHSFKYLSVAIFVPVNLWGATFSQLVMEDGPVGYYRLDEASGSAVVDGSGFDQAGQYMGINLPTLGLPGFLSDGNEAIGLSGSSSDGSFVQIPGVVNPGATSFTLEAVVQTAAFGDRQMIFQQRDLNGLGRSLLWINETGVLNSFIGGTSRSSGLTVVAGEPWHLALVFERTGVSDVGEAEGALSFYANGVKGNTFVLSGASGVEASMGDYVIGTQKTASSQFFNGVIDELVFYDKALTDARVVEHYESITMLPFISSLVASPRGIEPGGSAVLSWELADGVTSLSIDQGIGVLAVEDGSITVSPTTTTVYTLTAGDGALTVTQEVTVEVGTIGPFRLNEFLAGNIGPLVDEDGDRSDWIELSNEGEVVGNLAGWFLTDDAGDLRKWMIPSLEVEGDGHSLVFASGKDRVGADGELHASFRLRLGGEYLALVEPDGVTVHHEFSPEYPNQENGISWGLDADGVGLGYFVEPTPRAENGESSQGFVNEEVVADVTRGFYDVPFNVTLTTEAVGADIYYTTDASVPTATTGTLYTGPFTIGTTTTLRAGAFRVGEVPLNVMTQSYLFIDDVLDQSNSPAGYPSVWQPTLTADYEMDNAAKIGTRDEIRDSLRALPTVSLVMEIDDWFNSSTDSAVGGVYSNSEIARGIEWERKVSAEFFDFPHGQEIQVNAGMRIYGNASRTLSRPKHNMRLVFRGVYGPSRLEFPLFGDSGEDDVVNSYQLRGQNGDSWFHPTASQREEGLYIRDQFARSLQEGMGQPSVKQDHVHLYVNGLYWGVFNTIERIESDSMANAFGGDEEDWDVVKASPPLEVEVEDGTPDAWNDLLAASETDLTVPENYEAIQEFLNLENFIDWLLINYYNGNTDWDRNNWFAARERVGNDQFRFFVWDSERSLLSETQDLTTRVNVGRPTGIHLQLTANPDYRALFGDRVHRHFFNGGTFSAASARVAFDRWVTELQVPLVAESARWGDAQRPEEPYTVGDEWMTEVNFQRNTYLVGRDATVVAQLIDRGLYPTVEAPVLSQFGGDVPVGFPLQITAAGPEIFYTLDGSDPRDGGILYSSEEVLNESVIVKARTLSGGQWSALTSAPFYVGTVPANAQNVSISEIHYHSASDIDGEEFVELINLGPDPVDLRGVRFTDGVDVIFDEGTNPTLSVIPVGGRVVLVAGELEFVATYGDLGSIVLGEFSGGLDNGGERLALVDGNGVLIDEVVYDDRFPWPEAADGDGYSLVRIDPENSSAQAEDWRRSTVLSGTPGGSDELVFTGVAGVDSDGDGLDDLLEFALGSDPNSGEEGPALFSFIQTADGPVLQFSESLGSSGVRLVIEESMDLNFWRGAEGPVLIGRSLRDAASDWLLFEVDETEAKKFFRLNVEIE